MARTLIGQLILKGRDEATPEMRKAAAGISAAFNQIEASQKRFAAAAKFYDPKATWGVGFQKQLETLKLTRSEMDRVRTSYSGLIAEMKAKGLSKALQKQEIAAWRTATVGHFAAVRAEAMSTQRAITGMSRTLRGMREWVGKAALVSMGAYTTAYLGGVAVRGGLGAWSDRRRELFRQDMAGLTTGDKAKIAARSQSLSSLYPSVGVTEGMEMGRTARNLMGSTDRGNQILDTLVKGLVVLQSSKGVDAGTSEMNKLQRGLDVLGVNAAGDMGIQQVRNVIEGAIRASQVEGRDFSVGDTFQFSRRASLAGTGFSPEFLANVAPAFIQQWGADVAGTAFQSAYKALVIGSNDNASKKNLAYQKELGIRQGPGKGELVDGKLYGENPYAWAKAYLIPALEKAGVDLADSTEVAKAVGKIARAGKAQQMLAQMVTQAEQFDKNIEQYQQAIGTGAADRARYEDPRVALEAFTSSWGHLAAAVGGKGSVVLGFMNGFTDVVNKLAQAVNDHPMVQGAVGYAGLAAAGGTAYLAGKSVYGLITAGTNLNVAAVELQGAAAALSTGGTAGKIGAAGGAAAGATGIWGAIKVGAAGTAMGLWSALIQSLGDTPGDTYEEQVANQARYKKDLQNLFGIKDRRLSPGALGGAVQQPSSSGDNNYADFMRASGYRSAGGPLGRNGPRGRSAYSALGGETGYDPVPSRRPAPAIPSPRPDFSDATAEAERAGQQIKDALSVTAAPHVDTSGMDAALAKARELRNLLNGIASRAATINGAYSDYGVVP